MNSSIIPALTAAFEKAVSVARDLHEEAGFRGQVIGTLRGVFQQEIAALKNALVAEDKSRTIAVRELRFTITDALSEYWHNNDQATIKECLDAEFWNQVGPWLDRAER